MSVEIKCEHIDVGGSSVLLVSVKGGSSAIGTCSMGCGSRDISNKIKMFYIGSSPVATIVCPSHGSKRADKMISMSPAFTGMEDAIHNTIAEDMNKLNRGDSLEAGLRGVFGLLTDGVYTVYTSEYYPTDGNGTFFWGAYNIAHEVRGTAEHNRTIGSDKTFRPSFLVPGKPLEDYATKAKSITDTVVDSRRIQGIAYHLTGFHSVLLKGHHGAVSCLCKKLPFKCAVIEKITEPYTIPFEYVSAPPPAPEENAEGEGAPAETAPVMVKREGIGGFRCASVKIPLEVFPGDMLRHLLSTRAEVKPPHYKVLVHKSGITRARSVSNNVISREALERCDRLPDVEMLESAYLVDDLTDEQLNTLLAGDTELNGKVIISPNFYASIVTACNFLQFHDEKRFVDFSLSILQNPELNATHEYTAGRISRLEGNRKIYDFFKTVITEADPKYEKIMNIAERFVKDYDVRHK